MTDEKTPNASAAEKPAPIEKAGAPGGGASSRKIVMIGGGAAFLILVALVALLRPGRHAEPGPHESEEAPAARTEPEIHAEICGAEGPCSRPETGSALALLVQADSAYDSGDLPKARDLYLDLLLGGGDFGGAEENVRWAHGRLALCMAKLARGGAGARAIDDPPLDFREGPR